MAICKIELASVKVMRSHDYCHFEVSLSTTEAKTSEEVDELRKTAARLADKAVEQYKIAKKNQNMILASSEDHRWESQRAQDIRSKPEGERTPKQQAELKAFEDKCWREQRAYDYQDDWNDEDD